MSKKKHKKKGMGLQLFVRLIIFIMLFSVIGVVGIYLNGLNQQAEQRDAYEQYIQEQNTIQIDSLGTDTGLKIVDGSGNVATGVQINTSTGTTMIGSGENDNEELVIDKEFVENLLDTPKIEE